MKIHFGTSGWRGIIAKDFTFDNVEVASFAIAQHLIENNGKSVIIGYDTRFLSEEFAKLTAEVLAGYGIKSYFSKTDIPTPVIAYLTTERKADGAINITASHNDPIYNGIKFSAKNGGPALPEETKDIENKINTFFKKPIKIKRIPFEEGIAKKIITPFSERKYINAVENLIDTETIKKNKKRVVYDPFFATGRRYLPKILKHISNCTLIHGKRDVLFGGLHPEPTGKNLEPLIKTVIKRNADIGLATDGDADRFGAVDKSGTFISPNMVLPILYYYLLTERKMKGNVVRTVATTHLLDKIAKSFGYEAIETPVGFKYIGNAIVSGKAIFGGEESGGATIKGWIADKDGIFVDLLLLEVVSKRNKSLKELFKELESKFGSIVSKRIDFLYTGDRDKIEKTLKETVKKIEKSDEIQKIIEIDGTKIIYKDGSWILFRFSGTEPKIRVYCEADSKKKLDALAKRGEAIIHSIQGGE
jgi:alpha-D-glucose phosphate-specific phosphoglucomutase